MSRPHTLVTGATGFVGAAVVLELLTRTDDEILCLVRARPGIDSTVRLRQHLAITATHHDLDPSIFDEIAGRVHVLEGDITDPQLAELAEVAGPVGAVWHSAASLKYRDRDADEIRLHNVEGTRNVVALATAAGATEFNHISTAYVAGRRSGVIHEEPVPVGTDTNNQYERSKIDAEALVAASPLHHRIFRPSIVIGHSQTRRAQSDVGVYGFLREMQRFVEATEDPSQLPALRIAAHHETGLNLIPVDLVASASVEIALSGSDARYFHLTNGHHVLVRDAIPMVCEVLGLPEPTFTDSAEDLSPEDQLLNRYLDFYLPYLGGERIFDRTNTDAIVASRCDHPLDPPAQREVVTTYLETATVLPEPIRT